MRWQPWNAEQLCLSGVGRRRSRDVVSMHTALADAEITDPQMASFATNDMIDRLRDEGDG